MFFFITVDCAANINIIINQLSLLLQLVHENDGSIPQTVRQVYNPCGDVVYSTPETTLKLLPKHKENIKSI